MVDDGWSCCVDTLYSLRKKPAPRPFRSETVERALRSLMANVVGAF
jgi:hypothetical protein